MKKLLIGILCLSMCSSVVLAEPSASVYKGFYLPSNVTVSSFNVTASVDVASYSVMDCGFKNNGDYEVFVGTFSTFDTAATSGVRKIIAGEFWSPDGAITNSLYLRTEKTTANTSRVDIDLLHNPQ